MFFLVLIFAFLFDCCFVKNSTTAFYLANKLCLYIYIYINYTVFDVRIYSINSHTNVSFKIERQKQTFFIKELY